MFALTLSVNVLLLVLVFFISFCVCCMLSSSVTRLKKYRSITNLGNFINSSGFMTEHGPGSLVSIAIGYGLDGPGIES
jgi:hypothetical protein